MMTGVFLACGLAFGAVTVNVTDFGARGDAVADDTAAFQRALDVAERPLKVVIPKGDWRIVDGLRVSGGTTVEAAPDARIFCCGSRKKTRGYSFLTNRHHDGEGDRAIEIGGGVWDGQVGVGFNRKSFPVKDNPTGWGGRFLEFVNVRDLRLHDMVISNSVTYHVSLCKVDGFDIRRIKLTGTGRLWFNSDGIHLFGHCFNGIIDDLEGLNGQPNDDLLAFNADDYIGRVENFDMLQGPITNVFCSNIRSENCYTGTRIATDRSLIADVTVSNMVAGIRMSAFTVDSLRHCATPLFRECERPDGAGRLRNVRLVDSSFWVSERKYEGEIANVESNVEGEGLVFRNVRRILEKDAAPERPFFSIRNLRRTDVDFGDRRETVPARAQRTFSGPVLDFTLAPTAQPSLEAVFTAADGRVTRRRLVGTAGAEGSAVYVIPKAEVAKWKRIALFVDGAEARRGEDGYALTERGLVTHFIRDEERWCPENHWMAQHYVAMKTPRKAFVGIVDSLQYEYQCWCVAEKGVYRTYPEWEIDRIGEPVYEDIVYVVYELPPTADYNDMAKLYRRHFARRFPDLKPIAERQATQPSLAKLKDAFALRQICARKWPADLKLDPAVFNRDFTADDEPRVRCVKSFARTLEDLKALKAAGMDDVALCVAGWQAGGYDGRCPSVFPVEPVAGGEEELRKLIAGAQALGFVIDAHQNFTDSFTCSPRWNGGEVAGMKADGSLFANPDFWDGGHPYDTCLKSVADRYLYDDLRRTRALGFAGAAYVDVFSAAWPYHCCNPRHPATRRDTERIQVAIAKFCRGLNGGFASECCFDHMIPYVDYINYAQCYIRKMRQWAAKGRHVGWDEVVPFFELAFHDVVLSNPDKVTQEVPTGADRLLLWEFGGRPIVYYWEAADIPKMKGLYDEFRPLRHLQGVAMTEHRRIGDGLVRVTYANGERMYLNYDATRSRLCEGVSLAPLGWKLKERK